MVTEISATDLARELSDVLSRVRYKGEKFTVIRNGIPIATISPVAPTKGITVKEFVELMRTLPMPDEDFAKDLEEIHKSQPLMEPPPKWDS
jgi:prevent-host-death family protein